MHSSLVRWNPSGFHYAMENCKQRSALLFFCCQSSLLLRLGFSLCFCLGFLHRSPLSYPHIVSSFLPIAFFSFLLLPLYFALSSTLADSVYSHIHLYVLHCLWLRGNSLALLKKHQLCNPRLPGVKPWTYSKLLQALLLNPI